MNIEVITEEAIKVREVFEKHAMEIGKNSFGSFPEGACGNVSDFLGYWLQIKHIEGLTYVWGDKKDQTHGWLESEGYIIDITADQFGTGLPKVFINKDRSFHNTFLNQRKSAPSISPYLISELRIFIKLMKNAKPDV